MKHLAGSVSTTILALALAAPAARAADVLGPDTVATSPQAPLNETPTTVTRAAPEPAPSTPLRPRPVLKLSYERLSMGNTDGSAVPLEALHLDLYAISRPWFRIGVETEAGRGSATMYGAAASLKYGLLGLDLGFQVPARVTPFVEGHLAGGVLEGKLDGAVAIPGTGVSITGASAATWMVSRGVDAGVELYALGPVYVFGALGWTRNTWGNADYTAMLANASAGLKFKDVTHDSLTFKIGLGF
ncbi:MAG TPA: hypothetical protein VHJ20_19145 [Polyangia bacterium]|nr:hypothetical protein [Polyangia bacterium]